MNDNASHAFNELGPNAILDAVESLGFWCDGRLVPLNSYENRVYRVGIEEAEPLVGKFYRPGRWSDEQIREEQVFSQELADAEVPVVPPMESEGQTLFSHGPYRFSLYPYQPGRPPEFDNPEHLELLGRFVARIHALGAGGRFTHRPTIGPDEFGDGARAYLLESDWIPADLLPAYESVSRDALERVARCYEAAGDVANIRLHGDMHAGNILWHEDMPFIVDLDDARNGPAIQDLWMFLSGDRRDQTIQLSDLMEGYEQFADFDPRELHLVETLRTLRIMHHAAWIARRWTDP
ncbi:MAG: serine/threonine protein kinase, partial [Gammaproteobacteria bacterium]